MRKGSGNVWVFRDHVFRLKTYKLSSRAVLRAQGQATCRQKMEKRYSGKNRLFQIDESARGL
jgi:hypothetical protein